MGLQFIHINESHLDQIKNKGYTISNGFYILTKELFDKLKERSPELIIRTKYDYDKYNKNYFVEFAKSSTRN